MKSEPDGDTIDPSWFDDPFDVEKGPEVVESIFADNPTWPDLDDPDDPEALLDESNEHQVRAVACYLSTIWHGFES